jgi:hypothetical protein
MGFRDLVCEHLAQYKENVIGIKENGTFRYGGKDIPISHILPIIQSNANILEQYRDQFLKSEYYPKDNIHRFFHHLNSSQALCFNLFYPLIAENALGLFLRYLKVECKDDLNALFEKESHIEVAARRTSFDFYIQVALASKIFVEVKYTERGFGKAKNDNEHRKKFYKTYLPLVKNSSYLVSRCQEENFFLEHYQVLRNLIHISNTDYVVFLFPSANSVVYEEACDARDNILTDAGRAGLKIILLEEFVSFLNNNCVGTPINEYYKSFHKKYLGYENDSQQIVKAHI